MAEHLLARFAENMFWLARYMERAENLARILDVNESFARDQLGQHNWLPVLQMNADHERFLATGAKPTAAAVIAFYIIDRDNPTSIIYSVRAARANARTVRHLISTEMWTQLNVFYNRLSKLRQRDVSVRQLQEYDEAEGSPTDDSQWNALLRSVAGYHAYRRVHPRGISPKSVATFLIFEDKFPRSIARSVNEIRGTFSILQRRHRLPGSADLAKALEDLNRIGRKRDSVDWEAGADGLHQYADQLQLCLMRLTGEVNKLYFGAES